MVFFGFHLICFLLAGKFGNVPLHQISVHPTQKFSTQDRPNSYWLPVSLQLASKVDLGARIDSKKFRTCEKFYGSSVFRAIFRIRSPKSSSWKKIATAFLCIFVFYS